MIFFLFVFPLISAFLFPLFLRARYPVAAGIGLIVGGLLMIVCPFILGLLGLYEDAGWWLLWAFPIDGIYCLIGLFIVVLKHKKSPTIPNWIFGGALLVATVLLGYILLFVDF